MGRIRQMDSTYRRIAPTPVPGAAGPASPGRVSC